MNTENQLAAQLIRQLATLKTLNKLSGTHVNEGMDDNYRVIPMPGYTLVHLGQLKQALGFTGSDEDFTIHYWEAFFLLRRHELLAFGSIRRDSRRTFENANAYYNRWFFHISDRACELARQLPDDARLMQCLDLFRTQPRSRVL